MTDQELKDAMDEMNTKLDAILEKLDELEERLLNISLTRGDFEDPL